MSHSPAPPAIERLSAEDLRDSAKQFAALLTDVVGGGASVGFLAGLGPTDAAAWWQALAPAVAEERILLWATRDADRITGTIQLRRETLPNGRHRAEIAKLMVHPDARGLGLGRHLLRTAERAAADHGATLLILDTETGSPAERLYRTAGWTEVGTIPGYATDPAGVPKPTTLFYKTLG